MPTIELLEDDSTSAPTAACAKCGRGGGDVDGTVYGLKITHKKQTPKVWRRIEVEDTMTLDAMHDTIQRVMGWKSAREDDDTNATGEVCHEFRIKKQRYGPALKIVAMDGAENDKHEATESTMMHDERLYTLQDVLKGEKHYKFGYYFEWRGDKHIHEIHLEQIHAKKSGVSYPLDITHRALIRPQSSSSTFFPPPFVTRRPQRASPPLPPPPPRTSRSPSPPPRRRDYDRPDYNHGEVALVEFGGRNPLAALIVETNDFVWIGIIGNVFVPRGNGRGGSRGRRRR